MQMNNYHIQWSCVRVIFSSLPLSIVLAINAQDRGVKRGIANYSLSQ